MQNQYFFYEINPKIICIPHFSINGSHFKYHDQNYNNSFFLYLKKKQDILNLNEHNIYFVNSGVIDNYPFFTAEYPCVNFEPNKKFIDLFINNFNFSKNDDIFDKINELKKNKLMIGIHIRSNAQKMIEDPEYLSISINDRLQNVHKKLEELNKEYIVFIITS